MKSRYFRALFSPKSSANQEHPFLWESRFHIFRNRCLTVFPGLPKDILKAYLGRADRNSDNTWNTVHAGMSHKQWGNPWHRHRLFSVPNQRTIYRTHAVFQNNPCRIFDLKEKSNQHIFLFRIISRTAVLQKRIEKNVQVSCVVNLDIADSCNFAIGIPIFITFNSNFHFCSVTDAKWSRKHLSSDTLALKLDHKEMATNARDENSIERYFIIHVWATRDFIRTKSCTFQALSESIRFLLSVFSFTANFEI